MSHRCPATVAKMSRAICLKGTSKNRREHSECKAHGAQRPRHINQIGEGATKRPDSRFARLKGTPKGWSPGMDDMSTAQRSNRSAQQVFRGALEALHR